MKSDSRRFYRKYPVVTTIVALNVLVFVAQLVFGKQFTNFIDLHPVKDAGFHVSQLVTYIFGHGGFLHLVLNTISFMSLGYQLEKLLGSKKFTALYLATGVCGGLSFLLSQQLTGGIVPCIGASAAVMGLFAAFACRYPNDKLIIIPIPYPIKAKWLFGFVVMVDVVCLAFYNTGIAHSAHLGGEISGLILSYFMFRKGNLK